MTFHGNAVSLSMTLFFFQQGGKGGSGNKEARNLLSKVRTYPKMHYSALFTLFSVEISVPQIWEKLSSACGGAYQLGMPSQVDSVQKYSISTLMLESWCVTSLGLVNVGFYTLLWKSDNRDFQLDIFKVDTSAENSLTWKWHWRNKLWSIHLFVDMMVSVKHNDVYLQDQRWDTRNRDCSLLQVQVYLA